MLDDFNKQAEAWHGALPGIVRAFLLDHGVSDEVIDRNLLGWDGEHITVPIRNCRGRVVFFERWHSNSIGKPNEPEVTVELLGRDVLKNSPEQVVIAEGILEALVLQSAGFAAVSASGSGRYFKAREWAGYFRDIPSVLVAFKNGPHRERQKWKLDRDGVAEKILALVRQAKRVDWPLDLGLGAGAFEFFVQGPGTREGLEALWDTT